MSSWLEQHFKGRFRILSTENADVIRYLSFKVKNTLVEEVALKGVQVSLQYDLRLPDLGLNPDEVAEMFVKARQYRTDASGLFACMNQVGTPHFQLGIQNGSVLIYFFDEPLPDFRKKCLSYVQKACAAWGNVRSFYDVAIYIMEPDATPNLDNALLPLSELKDLKVEHPRKLIYSVLCPREEAFNADKLDREWAFNLNGARFSTYFTQSNEAVDAWLARRPDLGCTHAEDMETTSFCPSPNQLIFGYTCENQEIEAVFDIDKRKVLQIKINQIKKNQ